MDRFSISSALTHTVNTVVKETALVYDEEDVNDVYKVVMKERIIIEVQFHTI